MLVMSDRHHDNPASHQDMTKKHLDYALERKAPVIDLGDWFCAMQGKYDRRSSKSAIREEHNSSNYLDLLVDTSAEFLAPYAEILAWFGTGNHELSIKDRYETDLTSRLVKQLNDLGSNVKRHKYSGFTQLRFELINPETGEVQKVITKILWHTHGYGGGGPVTKDIIQTNRQGVYLDGVDLVMSGHTHDKWVFPVATVNVSTHGRVVHSERVHVKVPSAKEKFGTEAWEDLKGMPPKGLGSCWVDFEYDRKGDVETINIDPRFLRP